MQCAFGQHLQSGSGTFHEVDARNKFKICDKTIKNKVHMLNQEWIKMSETAVMF